MAKINVLDPKVFNKIAAGEVVERPSSIVKELVENSIDAGARHIEVSIFEGGIKKIIISDDGSGILEDDLELAFLPHATSKITDFSDLFSLLTLGFRGEALASIASVTKVEVTSKTEGNKGNTIKLEGGKIIAKGEKGSPVGTQFIIEDLFFNTPARQKFLKAPKKEETEITTMISRLILANPNIAFKYSADNKLIFSSSGRGVVDAICAIYGTKIMENLVEINHSEGDYSLTGFIGKTTFFKSNRSYQTTIINNRFVADSTASMAISQCYESYMMKHCFPFCVLYLSLPSAELDVNVHPNKLEVRFSDNKKVYDFVYRTISTALLNDITKKTQDEIEFSTPISSPSQLNYTFTPQNFNIEEPKNTEFKSQENQVEETLEQKQPESTTRDLDFILDIAEANSLGDVFCSSKDSLLGEIMLDKLTEKNQNTYTFDSHDSRKVEPKPIQTQLISDSIEDKHAYLSTQIIGKLFNTFIIVEIDDNVYFIDQHAAHERLLFDQYIKNIKKKEISIQPLLIPYTISTNHNEEDYILENLDLLRDLGFEIDHFGDQTFKISAIPSLLPNLNVTAFFESFLSNLGNIINLKSIDLVVDHLAETACKHAVKGGDDLKREELIKLVSDFANGTVTLQCPHGRPFVVKFTRRDLDKWFKRTV